MDRSTDWSVHIPLTVSLSHCVNEDSQERTSAADLDPHLLEVCGAWCDRRPPCSDG